MTIQNMQQIAVTIAHKHEIDPTLVCAVCHHESGGWFPYAIRYEPAFYDRYVESQKLITTTEKSLRAHSFGLMQIMGQTARELGFMGDYLTELCEPAIGIEYGCRKLKRCLDKHKGVFHDALLEYNGGANLAYPGLVMQHYEKYKNVQTNQAAVSPQ
jgi:soluble lytic murein transglycosylase-like protein